MLSAAKLLVAISCASLASFASTFVPKIWQVGFDVRPVRVITLVAFLIAAITARILLGAAFHRDNVARGIVAPFPYTTYPGIDSPSVDSAHRKTG
jgi:hypothetical protein